MIDVKGRKMILTDDECRDVYNAAMALPDRSIVVATRFIEDAVIKRLAGVSVEPVCITTESVSDIIPVGTKLYTGNAFNTALAAARVQALEEAIRAASFIDLDCENAIRALLGKEST